MGERWPNGKRTTTTNQYEAVYRYNLYGVSEAFTGWAKTLTLEIDLT